MTTVLQALRQGMTLKDACREAGTTKNKVAWRRRKDLEYDAKIKEILNGQGRKPIPEQHITLKSKKQVQSQATKGYWEAWDDAALEGTLAEDYPAKEMEPGTMEPYRDNRLSVGVRAGRKHKRKLGRDR